MNQLVRAQVGQISLLSLGGVMFVSVVRRANRVSSALPQSSDEDEHRFSADKPCWLDASNSRQKATGPLHVRSIGLAKADQQLLFFDSRSDYEQNKG